MRAETTSLCPHPDELDLFVDGEVTENRAEFLRQHVRTCSLCGGQVEKRRQLLADIQAPVPGMEANALVAGVLQKLEQPPADPRRVPALVWGGTAALVSAAAALVLFLTFHSRTRSLDADADADVDIDMGSFQGRGAHSDRLARQVGISLFTVGPSRRRLEPGAALDPDGALMVAYRNLERTRPLYLLAFAVDATNTIHWLYPAYLTDKEDPAAVALAYAERETPLPESVVLDHPAPGALRFVVVVSPTPKHVSDVEHLDPGDLHLAGLRARWPQAVITELPVTVAKGDSK